MNTHICMYVCIYIYTVHEHTYIYIYIYIHTCICQEVCEFGSVMYFRTTKDVGAGRARNESWLLTLVYDPGPQWPLLSARDLGTQLT